MPYSDTARLDTPLSMLYTYILIVYVYACIHIHYDTALSILHTYILTTYTSQHCIKYVQSGKDL